jgi:peptidoglycan/xylan/chitin deacetylase (PgdA/CDA1 family)
MLVLVVVFGLIAVCGACGRTGAAPEVGAAGAPAGSTAAAGPGPPSGVAGAESDGVVLHGPARRARIALTFDSNMTDTMLRRLASGEVDSYANAAVLDELEASRTPATFFLSGKWIERYPELSRRIAADPDAELASHSYAHLGFTDHCYDLGVLPREQMAADVEHSFAVLASLGGHQTRFFRFPGGCYDPSAVAAIAPTGATPVQYDVVGDDAFTTQTAPIVRSVLSRAHDGAIVVLHITKANAPRTADALPIIISGLRARGFDLVTLSALLT